MVVTGFFVLWQNICCFPVIYSFYINVLLWCQYSHQCIYAVLSWCIAFHYQISLSQSTFIHHTLFLRYITFCFMSVIYRLSSQRTWHFHISTLLIKVHTFHTCDINSFLCQCITSKEKKGSIYVSLSLSLTGVLKITVDTLKMTLENLNSFIPTTRQVCQTNKNLDLNGQHLNHSFNNCHYLIAFISMLH